MKYLFYLLFEVFLFPIYLIAGFIGIFINLKPSFGGKKIVLVHGWLTSNLPYIFLKRYLENKGFSVYMPNISLMASDLNKESMNLKEYIETNKLENFTLVGLSTGANISYLYLQSFDGWTKTKRFISIGALFKGTPLVYLAPFLGSARQLIPGSKFLKKLNQKSPLNREKIICIFAKYDELIPKYSSKLKGVKHEEVPVLGHVVLQVVAKETFALVEKYAK